MSNVNTVIFTNNKAQLSNELKSTDQTKNVLGQQESLPLSPPP